MKELLELLVKSLVDDTDSVIIEESEQTIAGEPETLFRVNVAQSDMGKLIGRHGRTAKDIRILVRALAAREGNHVSIDIED
ncbi:MAG: KH domain-containing protein [Oscillospiraceae bacterium]|jgi:predicted RNA-binding protein YlqC (UPF0109 family)|nr:KH domain-containing protein [Oscillospiraceae bacterium]